MRKTLMAAVAGLLAFGAPVAMAAPDMPHALSPLSAGVFIDVPDEGPLAEAVSALVEGYGIVVGYGTDKRAELRPNLHLTRGDLVQWLSAAADRVMQTAQDLEPDQWDKLPLLKSTMCSGNGWRQANEATHVAGYDVAAPWSEAFTNLVERYGAALVGADRRFDASTPVTVAQAQACLAAFDPTIRLQGKQSAWVTRGEFVVALHRALRSNSQQMAAWLEAAELGHHANHRAR